MNYDAVIIGAGPSGLAAAVRLAHFGVKTCLLEAHTRPGGLNSWHHVRNREISSGLHAFTNYSKSGREGALGKLLRQLRVNPADLELCGPGRASIRFPGLTLSFNDRPDYLRQQIAEHFPKETDGYDRFRKLVLETDEGELTGLQTSAREVMEKYLRDPLLVDMLLCPVLFYGCPGGVGDGRDAARRRPDLDWLLFCVVWKCLYESGLAYPAHGMSKIWNLLIDRFRQDGGLLRLANRVSGFISENGRVKAAVTEAGEEVAGDIFFSSAGGRETQILLGEEAEAIPAGGVSIAEGIALLDAKAADQGFTDAVVFYSLSDELRFRRPDSLVEESCGALCLPANYPGIDENILKISELASYPAWRKLDPLDYRLAKERAAAGMEKSLLTLGFDLARGKAEAGRFGRFDDLFTPVTLWRFTRHAEGALYGSPVKARSGLTSRENLFLIGADQGFHGIVGAMLSGVAMANLHCLAKRK